MLLVYNSARSGSTLRVIVISGKHACQWEKNLYMVIFIVFSRLCEKLQLVPKQTFPLFTALYTNLTFKICKNYLLWVNLVNITCNWNKKMYIRIGNGKHKLALARDGSWLEIETRAQQRDVKKAWDKNGSIKVLANSENINRNQDRIIILRILKLFKYEK